MLKGHTGLVKGVTWDPVGKFIASQSDDRTLKIWRTSDFTCEATIKEPFEECGGTTHVLRLSWSPDGLYLGILLLYAEVYYLTIHENCCCCY